MNEGQVLALLGREGLGRATHAGHPIQLFVHTSDEEARMNVRYRGCSQLIDATRTLE
jgi:ABC-type microcin C transport system duplicated ATPase subunit YejF